MKTKNLTLFAFFLAIELILLFTPLGFLRIGPLSATLMHIPVIIIAITMGRKYGCALGLIFGLCSIWSATFTPGITSFCFSPFITVGNVSGNFASIIIALVPRVLIGYCAASVYTFGKKHSHSESISVIAGALSGALTIRYWFYFYGNQHRHPCPVHKHKYPAFYRVMYHNLPSHVPKLQRSVLHDGRRRHTCPRSWHCYWCRVYARISPGGCLPGSGRTYTGYLHRIRLQVLFYGCCRGNAHRYCRPDPLEPLS